MENYFHNQERRIVIRDEVCLWREETSGIQSYEPDLQQIYSKLDTVQTHAVNCTFLILVQFMVYSKH